LHLVFVLLFLFQPLVLVVVPQLVEGFPLELLLPPQHQRLEVFPLEEELLPPQHQQLGAFPSVEQLLPPRHQQLEAFPLVEQLPLLLHQQLEDFPSAEEQRPLQLHRQLGGFPLGEERLMLPPQRQQLEAFLSGRLPPPWRLHLPQRQQRVAFPSGAELLLLLPLRHQPEGFLSGLQILRRRLPLRVVGFLLVVQLPPPLLQHQPAADFLSGLLQVLLLHLQHLLLLPPVAGFPLVAQPLLQLLLAPLQGPLQFLLPKMVCRERCS
jgi:hypothetical protein